jgi:hypothetical protein
LIPGMPRPRPLRLHKETNRHGTVVWYVRVGQGPRVRIKGEYGTPEFEAAYLSAVNGERPRTHGKAAHGTLGWLFDLYRQTSAWTGLAKSTRDKREQIMMRVLETAGHEPVSAITEAHVIAGRERRAATPSSAQAFLDTLHGVFKWAVKSKLAKIDPTLNVKVETKPKRRGGYPPWTDDDMAKFEAPARHARAGAVRHPNLYGFKDRRRRCPRPPACPQRRDQDRQRKNRHAGGNPDAGAAQGDDRGRADRRPRLCRDQTRDAVQ